MCACGTTPGRDTALTCLPFGGVYGLNGDSVPSSWISTSEPSYLSTHVLPTSAMLLGHACGGRGGSGAALAETTLGADGAACAGSPTENDAVLIAGTTVSDTASPAMRNARTRAEVLLLTMGSELSTSGASV